MKKILVLTIVMVFCATGLSAAIKKPGIIREQISVSSADIVENAINEASLKDKWNIARLGGHNVIYATIDAGECILTVKITYTKQNYIIEYKETNLNLNDEDDNIVINSTYNNKVKALSRNILKNL